MYQAPAVRMRCPGSRGWRVAGGALSGGAALVFVGWALLLAGVVPRLAWGIAGLAGAAALVVAWGLLRREPAWLLGWDGSHWSLASDASGDPVEVQTMDVMIDLGRWLLLRARLSGGGSQWLAVGWNDPGAAEHKALCTALYAQRSGVIVPTLPDRPPG